MFHRDALFFYAIFHERRDRKLDYVIKNNKNVYIRINDKGSPVTCSKNDRMFFEYSKAKNILNSLPKPLKKMHFCVKALPDIKPKEKVTNITSKRKVINTETSIREKYIPSDNVTRWIEKFGSCEDVLSEAKQREKELIDKLHKSDSELMDILHIIEIEKPKDLYKGWLLYKRIKQNRKERREVKDELIIVENVLGHLTDISFLHRKNIQKAINGLYNRQYSFRVVETDESDLANV